MVTLLIVIAVVCLALILGAIWGACGRLSDRTEGALIAAGGGALIVSIVSELLEPANSELTLIWLVTATFAGAVAFSYLDKWVDEKFAQSGGFGLMLAITLDGVPENLALGVALIDAGPLEVAALAGAIFLSNLPEAAGGAREMRKDGKSSKAVLALWGLTALLLGASAIAGNLLLTDVGQEPLAAIKCFAAGAIVASLATEVFPKAYKLDTYQAGIFVAIGLLSAFSLGQL